MTCACKFVEATAGVGVESRGGTGLFTAFFDAVVGVAVAGLFYGVVLTSLRLF